MLRELDISWDHIKSYASEARLDRRLNEDKDMYPDNNDRYIKCRTPEGRWTAIVLLDRTTGGYAGRYEFLKV
jgi:hypothetical protein